jgi:hypothetical protein
MIPAGDDGPAQGLSLRQELTGLAIPAFGKSNWAYR